MGKIGGESGFVVEAGDEAVDSVGDAGAVSTELVGAEVVDVDAAEQRSQVAVDVEHPTSEHASYKQTSYKQTFYKQTSYKQTSYKQTSYKQTSYKQTSYKQTSYKQTSYKRTRVVKLERRRNFPNVAEEFALFGILHSTGQLKGIEVGSKYKQFSYKEKSHGFSVAKHSSK